MSMTSAKPFVVLTLMSLATVSWCDEVKESTLDLSSRSTRELIEQLGSTNFESRQTASRELTRRGESIRAELQTALGHADLEIRLRARKLLAGMAHADLQRRLTAFIEDVEGKRKHDLPAWREFEATLGSDKATRELFAEMIVNEVDLLITFKTNKKRVVPMLSGRIQAFENGIIPGLPHQASASSVATLLFLASNELVPLDTSFGFEMYRFLNQSASRKAIEENEHSPIVKKLLVSWISRGMSSSSLARSGLLLAERYKLNDTALALSRDLINKKDTPSYTLPYAVITIGRYGNENDVPGIESMLANDTVCHTWHNGKFKQPIRIQVRDVALAVLVHLTNQDHKQYGFDLLRPDPNGLFYVYTMGFPDDEKREKALAKWQEWSANQTG